MKRHPDSCSMIIIGSGLTSDFFMADQPERILSDMPNHRLINKIAVGVLTLGGFLFSHSLQAVSAFAKLSGKGQAPSSVVMKEMAPSELGHIGH